MKLSVGVAVVIILALIGTVVAAYSYIKLQQVDVLFNENSIQLGGYSYLTWQANLGDPGNYFIIGSPRIVGGVGSVGTGVDFYLVNDTNWNLWSTDTGLRSALSAVYLNSDAVSSQSAQGQFSFTPATLDSYIVVLVNDEYPNVNSASLNVNITFQYISLFNFLAFIAGLAMLGIAIVSALLIMITRRKVRVPILQVAPKSA